ncbi:insulinase family protein [bacterium]|nr:insulinase family protein [bacterium]
MTNTSVSASASASQTPATASATVQHRYLSNGCECYLEQVDFAPLVTLQMWVKTGSLDEQPHEFGMAHVLEHMLFKGTERFPKTGDIARQVEAAGGEINAYTTFDHTVFYINAPREFAFQGAELLFDVVCSSLLDSDELSRELEVVVEEIRRSRDNPSARLSHTLFAKLFAGHPKGRPVIGYEAVVKSFTRESLMAFYKRWYIPNNMFFVGAGDFHMGEMSERLESLAARFAPASLPSRVWSRTHARPPLTSPVCEVIHGPYQETRLQLTVPAPCLEDSSTPAWEMFASILGQGDSSRLSQSVKDEAQLVTAIDSSLYTPRFPYGFAGFGFYGRSESALDALQCAMGEIARLAKDGPTSAELQRVLTAAKAEKIYSRESVEGLVRNIGNNLLTTAKLEFDTIFLQKLNQVTTSQVQSCAKEVCQKFLDGQITCVAATNEEHAEQVNAKTLAEAIHSCREILQSTLHGSLNKNSPQSELATQCKTFVSQRNPHVIHSELQLGSDAVLHFNRRVSQRLPVVSHVLVWRWGQHHEPIEKIGLNAFLAQMLTRGTTRQSYRAFVTELEDMGASISAFSSRDLFGLRLDALSEVQPRALRMLLDCLARPAFSTDQFERVMRETEEVLVAQKDSPGSRLSRLNGPLFFADHPYGRPLLGQLETLRTITIDDLVQQWQRLLISEKFVFSAAGSFDVEATFDTVGLELSEIAQNRTQRIAQFGALSEARTAPQMPAQTRIGFDILEREQAHISLGVRSYTLSDSRRTALEVACSVLGGQGGRLFMDLRDAQSLAYSVGCSQSPGLMGGTFTTYIGTAAEKTQQAIAGLKSHIETLARSEPSSEELMRAKNSLLGAQSLDSQHHHYQSSQLAMSDVYGLGYDNFLGFKERIEAVTAAQVSSALRDLLGQESACIAVVGPKGTWIPSEEHELCRWQLS